MARCLRSCGRLLATLVLMALGPALPAAAQSGPATSVVAGVPAGDVLNVRSGPGADFRIIGALSNGTPVILHGCRAVGSARWCEIEQITDMHEPGWVNGRFLREAAAATRPEARSAGASDRERVRFAAGRHGVAMAGTLAPGASRRYVLGARSGQMFRFALSAGGPGLSYQIFNPDRSFLLDQVPAAQAYQGQLWQNGDHVIEVINRGSRAQSYSASFDIR